MHIRLGHANVCFRFPPLLYEEEGKWAAERLWNETMAELEFFGVRGILDSMRGKV